MLFEKIMYFTAYKIVICGKQKQISLRSFSTSSGLHVFSSFSSVTFDYAVLSVMGILWSIPLRTRSIIPETSVVAPILGHLNMMFSASIRTRIICIELSKHPNPGLFPHPHGPKPQP